MAFDLNVDTLMIEGGPLPIEVSAAISSGDVERTIDSCPTLSLTIEDTHRTLLTQGYFAKRLTCQLDGYDFELASVDKTNDQLLTVWEDLAVAELRTHTDPYKADPGTVTRVQFVKNLLAAETPWIQLYVDPEVHEDVAQVELARGYVATSADSAQIDESYFGTGTSAAGGTDDPAAATATTTTTSGALTAAQIAGAAQAAGFSGNDLMTMVAIAFAESSGIATNTNHVGSVIYYGLWQIQSSHTALLATGSWSDPAANAKMAYSLYVASGGPSSSARFNPWETYTNGAYKKFLSQAQAGAASPSADYGSTSTTGSDASSDYKNLTASLNQTAEDSWTCFKRIFSEVNWNLYADHGNLYAGPDSAFIDKTPAYTVTEFSDGVDWVNFNWDVGKPVATATVTCRASRWVAPPGTVVTVPNIGLPSNWLVSGIKRSLFSVVTTLTLKAPAPELPEPPADGSNGPVDAGYFGNVSDQLGAAAGPGSTDGNYIWPVNGSHVITSPFGQRARDFHTGIDIGVPDGTPVFASRAGTVEQAGNNDPGGYGIAVYIAHRPPGTDNVVGPVATTQETRYAHLSSVQCRRGQTVTQGQVIGLSGHSGDATGPHLHFEIRVNGTAVDPQPILSAAAKVPVPVPSILNPATGVTPVQIGSAQGTVLNELFGGGK